MAFAGHLGVSLNVDMLVTEGDGIGDSRAEHGDSKNWATQVGERRNELTLKALFNEELGVVLQVPPCERDAAHRACCASTAWAAAAMSSARPTTRRWSRSGATRRRSSARRCAICTRPGTRSAGASPGCATTRPAPTPSMRRPAATTMPGLHLHLSFDAGAGPGAADHAAEGGDPARAGRQQPCRDELRDGAGRLRLPSTCT